MRVASWEYCFSSLWGLSKIHGLIKMYFLLVCKAKVVCIFLFQQVDTWTHDLIHKENKAKENSDWLLFMLESSTRGIVSLVEVAYLVGMFHIFTIIADLFIHKNDLKQLKFIVLQLMVTAVFDSSYSAISLCCEVACCLFG